MTFLLTKTPLLANIDTTHDILNNLPIGIIIFEKDLLCLSDTFKISFANQQARRLLSIPKDNLKKFLSFLPKYKEYNPITQHETDNNLYNHIFTKNILSKETSNTFICPNSSKTLLYIKTKHYKSKILVCIDNYTDERKTIHNHFIQSISYQYLLTLYHEINNPLNSLINTVNEIIQNGSCNTNHKKRIELLNFLIQFFLKNFILYFQIKTINKTEVLSSQKATIHLENLFTNITTKFSKLFSYKQITHNEHLTALTGLNVYANYSYFKNLIKMIYIYLYHRNDKGGSFNINVECVSSCNNATKVKIVFSNGRDNEMLHKCFTSITENERTIKDTARIHNNKIQTINMIEEIITVLASLLGIKVEINVNVNIQQVSIAVVINAFHNEDFGNDSELNERSPLHVERFNVVERTMCMKVGVSKLKNESDSESSSSSDSSSNDDVCLKLNECKSINNDHTVNITEQFVLNNSNNVNARSLNKQKTFCERKTPNYLALNYNYNRNKKNSEYEKMLQSKRKNSKVNNSNNNNNNPCVKSQQHNNNNNNNTSCYKNVQPRKRQSILDSLLKTIAKNNSNQLLPHNEYDDFIKQHSYTHFIPKVNHNILNNDNDFNNSIIHTMNNHCYRSKIHHSHSMLNLRDNYLHNTHEHYLINEDNESEYHTKQYNNESKPSLSPIRQCKKHVEICLNNNVHLNHLTIINHTTTASPIPEVSHNHKDVVDNTHNNNECSDCSSDQCNNNNNNNEMKKQSNNTIESPDMCIKRTLNVDTQLPTTSTCLNVSQKEIINEEDNNIITRRNKKLPSGLFTFIALDSLDENIKFPKKLQNNSKTRKLPLMKMNSIQNKTKYTLCNPNNNSNIILNPCQNNCNDVLIVDDEQFNVTSLSNVLLNLNIASDKCYNGKECMEKIQEKINIKCKCERSMYKLILLDVLMPYMNGIDAARKIQELVNNGDIDNSIKIVFISACVDQLSDFDELQKQIPIVKEFCQKPVKRSKIEEVVEKYYNV